MTLVVVPVTAGGAHAALAGAVGDAKQGDPLRPVTVIVPTNAAGVTARRALGRLGGVAAVDLVTLYRLAERLAGPALRAEQRLPVSTAVVDLAVRSVLRDTSTMFDEVAEHPSTVVALRDLYRELRVAGPDAADRLRRASRRGAEIVRVCNVVANRLTAGWYDEGDLVMQAITTVRNGDVDAALSRIVLFLPQTLGPLEVTLVGALGERGDLVAQLGFTGDASADRDLATLAAALTADPITPSTAPVAASCEVVSVTDADEEVRHAVRTVVDAARAGVPLARMAILWPTDRPYARLVEHHLGVAGIAWNGRPGTKVSERVVPRFLLDLLDVDRRGLRRRDLFDLLADVPVRDRNGRPLPVAAWERASRDAGVVKNDHWTPRLRSYATWQRRVAGERHGDDEPADDATPTSPVADAAESLATFVADLRRDLGRPGATRAWSAWAEWAVAQINDRLGIATIQHLGEAEFQAWEHTTRVLDRLKHLDGVGQPATRSEFRAVFAAEFDVAPGRLGRIGAGVTIGSLAGAVGLDVDLAVVLGAADGLMPAPPVIDPLIGDGERQQAGLATSDSVGDRVHRQFLGVVDSARRVVITTPRGDLRTSTVRQPSRWLAALGEVPSTSIASHASALLHVPFPAHAGEHRLRRHATEALTAGPEWLASLTAPEGDTVLARSLTLRAARRSSRLTEYDGDLTAAAVPRISRPMSPTQLQAWAACPHAYFVQYLLGVRAVEEPGDEMAITPIDRGNVLHQVLDRFHREVIAGQQPQPDRRGGWTAAHRARLIALLDEVSAKFEQSGRTGRAAYWAIDRQRLLHDLMFWVDHDSELVVARGSQVVASEQRFGLDGDVTVALPDGRKLAVSGSVDRIDRTAAGLVVTDHKVGSTRTYAKIERADPTAGGTRFQLPAYAAAATVIAAEPDRLPGLEPVLAEYSFFQKGGYKRIGYEFDADVWARVASDLQHVVSGIEAGWFPATAPKPQFQIRVECRYCEPDSLGTADRFAEWERKRLDPRLAPWFAIDDQPVAS